MKVHCFQTQQLLLGIQIFRRRITIADRHDKDSGPRLTTTTSGVVSGVRIHCHGDT